MKARRGLTATCLGASLLAADGGTGTGRRDGEPVPVRFVEGVLHGFLVLRDSAGAPLAQGDLLQVPREGGIDSRMVFRFRDGSLFDERVTFTQRDVFALQRYRLVQQGPSFEEDATIDLARDGGRYEVTVRDRETGESKTERGTLDLPADVYNGMPILIVKNLVPRRSATVHLVAFTPAPRLIQLELAPLGPGQARFGGESRALVRYALRPRLGLLLAIGAKLTGRTPPDTEAWFVTEDVPAFVRFEGPLSMTGRGPLRTIELASPAWRATEPGRSR